MSASPNERFLCFILAGSTCGSDTSSRSAWLEESFGKFSIYVDYKDLREINTGFDSFEALDLLSTSQVAKLTLGSGALNSAALINMVFERLENGNSFQNAEEFFVALTQTSQPFEKRQKMPQRRQQITQTPRLRRIPQSCKRSAAARSLRPTGGEPRRGVGRGKPNVGALSSVFDHMTALRQQELAPVLLGYLKQRRASGSTCGSDTSSLSAWLEESFGKFSIYVDYKDLREINTGFDSFEALDLLSTSQVAQLTLGSGALNSAALINMVFERLENGNSFQNAEEFFVALTQTSQDLDINPVVRDIMMNRTFAIISLHFADFATDDWVSWFTVKLTLLLPSLTAEMLQTATSHTDCGEYHIIVGALSSVFDHMTSLRQQELAPVLLGYLKQRRASGSTCGSDTSSLSAWLEESFGKFSIYVDYKDLREINTGFDSFEALDLLSTSQVAQLTLGSGALNSAALINMVFERLENGNSFQNAEEFFVALTQTSQDLDINPVVRDIMMNSNLRHHQPSLRRLCDRRLGFLVHGETDSSPSQLDGRDAPDGNITHRLRRIPHHVRSAAEVCDRPVARVP
ncbi:putative threonine-rich GPI-anchored glyco isoform X2 [Labeo rohita]|uniref:Putative threonine-rich GPI-anchored glyco isoform X2 n=1 Tax=Labeo rohita TaxID=84645 RepID=A0A498N800_LABRO|nr:putative threonine-rich GPI-anchored glyco isoform X2 [Labeo rohita]